MTPRVLEEGHHARHLAALTGIHVQENQARRLLNDIAEHRAWLQHTEGEDVPEGVAAYRWMTRVYAPALARVPPALGHKLQPAELYHEILEHRWYLAERLGRDVDLSEAVDDYVDSQLTARTDEQTILPEIPFGDEEEPA
jgi:hypothetical protein